MLVLAIAPLEAQATLPHNPAPAPATCSTLNWHTRKSVRLKSHQHINVSLGTTAALVGLDEGHDFGLIARLVVPVSVLLQGAIKAIYPMARG